MNCPQCKQMVGNDQYSYGEFDQEIDAHGVVVRVWRWLFVSCDFCGVFRVAIDGADRILRIFGPFRGSVRIDAVRSAIPELRQEVAA